MNHLPDYWRALSLWLTGHTSEVAHYFSRPTWNWDLLADTAAGSHILPSLKSAAAVFIEDSTVPEDFAALLSTTHAFNTERNRIALNQARELTAALNHSGIQPVALKGLANILSGIYPDPGSRFLADIDLLVPPDQFPVAVAAFHQLGYVSQDAQTLEFAIGHSLPAFVRINSLEVDLHRTTGLGPCASFLPASDLIREATVHRMEGAELLLPSPEHLVVHHIMHSQMHDVYRERVAPSLRTLYDLFLLDRHFQDSLDWRSIEAYFCQRGQFATLVLYMLEFESFLGLPSPIRLQLTGAIRLRRWRRELLQRYPFLRRIDPMYYFSAGIQPRTRRLREILAQPGGLRYLISKLYNPAFYTRLRSDFK